MLLPGERLQMSAGVVNCRIRIILSSRSLLPMNPPVIGLLHFRPGVLDYVFAQFALRS